MTKTKAKTKTTLPPETAKDMILLAALPDVAFDGWTEDGLMKAAGKNGFDAAAVKSLFPKGVISLMGHLSDWADRETLKIAADKLVHMPRIRDKITTGVRIRLEVLQPWKEAVRASLNHRRFSSIHLPRLVWQTADRLWLAAGDTAKDYNRYTKRFLLSGVITSTTLYWLGDTSEEQEKTWDFLDHRIENVLNFGKFISRFKKKA